MSPPDLVAVLFALALVFWLTSIYRPAGRRIRCSAVNARLTKAPFARDAPGPGQRRIETP